MVEKMVHDGAPDDMSAHSLFDKATSAKNMMSRIRGHSPSQWVLATQPRIPESLMIDDEDEDHVPHKDITESQDDGFALSIRVRDAARRAFIAVDIDQKLRRQLWCILVCHPHLTIIICRTAVWAQACGSERKTSFVIIVHVGFIRCPRSFLDPCWCIGWSSITILPLLVHVVRTSATVTTPVRCVLVNTLQYHDTVDFCARI